MQLNRYPEKTNLFKAMKNYMHWKDIFEYLRNRGVLVSGFSKDDYARVGVNFYFSKETYLDLKQRLDGEINFIKSSRYYIDSEKVDDLKNSISEIVGKNLGNDDTSVVLFDNNDDTWEFEITYTESKPGMIDLLDSTERRIPVKVNTHKSFTSLDFNLESASDHKKVTEILTHIQKENPEVSFALSDIDLEKLDENNKISLFKNFFEMLHSDWELKKINKLKVNRHSKDQKKKLDDLLQGINSALLDGENLIENEFIKTITKKDFHFTMASMRFDNKKTSEYIDFSIEFKSRPVRFEAKILNSGEYEESKDGLIENKKVLNKDLQNSITFDFQNQFFILYKQLLNKQRAEYEELNLTDDLTLDETAASNEIYEDDDAPPS
ncbi:hypothetical protein R0K30_15035 [Bacillus sp. SIMBA_154]|uniref:hypothetical protein n=1 Tax=Bacillus sp. SIMBA_154 TaxID=3080859 RepID=UPI00397BB00C